MSSNSEVDKLTAVAMMAVNLSVILGDSLPAIRARLVAQIETSKATITGCESAIEEVDRRIAAKAKQSHPVDAVN